MTDDMDATTPAPIVVVDSNQIVRVSWRLDSPEWTVLLHQARAGRICLVVAEIVVIEAIGSFRRELREQRKAMVKALRATSRMTGKPMDATETVEGDAEAAANYEAHLREVLSSNSVAMPDPEVISVRKLTARASDRVAPFDDNGNGFRDSALWLTLLHELAEARGTPAVLVSNDNKAFRVKNELNPALAHEVAALGLPAVALHASVRDYLLASGVDDPRLHAELLRLFTERRDTIESAIVEALVTAELPGSTAAFNGWIFKVGDDAEVEFIGATIAGGDDNLALARFTVSFDATIELTLSTERSVATHVGRWQLKALATATYDRSADQLDGFEVEPPTLDHIPDISTWRHLLSDYPMPSVEELLDRLQETNSHFPASTLPSDFQERLAAALVNSLPPDFEEKVAELLANSIPSDFSEKVAAMVTASVPPDLEERMGQMFASIVPSDFSERVAEMLADVVPSDFKERIGQMLATAWPPDLQERLRSMLADAFSPSAIERLTGLTIGGAGDSVEASPPAADEDYAAEPGDIDQRDEPTA